jgi:sigma-B regulation protein RsbU (phosphoserine phosphatase)
MTEDMNSETKPSRTPESTPSGTDHARCIERIGNLKECFRISALINSTLQLDEVLENIMTTSRAILKADACSLMLVDEQTCELVFEVAQGPVADKLKCGFRLRKGEGIAGHVFETGSPQLVEDAYCDPRFHQDFDRKTGYRTHSILCVPLKVKDRVIGISQVINRLDGLPFDREDEETLTLLCDHAAIAIENARMHRDLLRKQQMESDLAFAVTVQRSFLPRDVPRVAGCGFRAHYQPALQVSGDFYDFIPLDDNRLGILIGDVSGKGVASALAMARLTSDFRLHAIRERDAGILVARINNLLCEQSCRGMFATLLYMVLDTKDRTITFVNAGHLPFLVWNPARRDLKMAADSSGPPLGILPDQPYPAFREKLKADDGVVLLTDGLLDAKNSKGDRFGWKRLEETLCRGGSAADDIARRLAEAVRDFAQGCPPADDTTFVVLSVEGP